MADDDDTQQNPFARPGFIIGAVVVAALIVAAVFLTVLNLNRDNGAMPPSSQPPTASDTAPSPTPTGDAGGASVCGLAGVETSGTVTTAPSAVWAYQGTVAYPTSPTIGAGDTAPEGYPFCFQHSPAGALFAAATSLATASNPEVSDAWAQYALSEGAYRDSLLSTAGATSDGSGVRLQVVGFRMLSYDGETARVDLAVRGSSQGQTITASAVYSMIWQDGDWKVNADVAEPFDFATIPDTSGYTAWAA